MNSQFKRGILELCVMALIRSKDCYGYELVEEISKSFAMSEGTIYPLLRRLTKDGLCETYLRESESGPPRKYYRMTKKGHESYDNLRKEWVTFIQHVNRIVGEG